MSYKLYTMLRTLPVLLVFCLAFSAGPSYGLSSLKIGVYNIHGGVGEDDVSDLPRIGRVLKSAAPEVVALNEVNRLTFGNDQDVVLAQEMGSGWQAVFAKTLNKPFPPAEYGNSIITKLPVVSSQSWLLSQYPDQERRGLMRVTVRKDGDLIHIFNTHMGLDATMRAIHAREILNIMATFTDGYKVLVGDFNEQRGAAAVELFEADLTDAWQQYGLGSANTFSAANPTKRIDFIFLDRRLAATSCYVPMFPDARVASDHLPVFADVLTPGAEQPVVNDISVRVNGQERLTAGDSVPPDPDAYTQGSVALVTSGETGPTEVVADNLAVRLMTPLYQEDFNAAPLGGAPPDWSFLFATADKVQNAGTVQLGGQRFWRQRSEAYAKYHYAPSPYPDWKNYEVSARIKTMSTGGGAWRLLAYNYPATDTAYETFKIEVRHNAGALPQLRIMKGGAQLAAATMTDFDADPYDWNVYTLQVLQDESAAVQVTRRLIAYVNGRRVAAAVDVIAGAPDPDEYSQGSIALTTIGGTEGLCEIYADDVSVRQFQPVYSEDFDGGVSPDWKELYRTPGETASAGNVPGRTGDGWRQSSDQYLKYHYAPVPYPAWQGIAFFADVRTAAFGEGKWRLNGYNYPSTDQAYDTYKMEVHSGGGAPKLRIMKGGTLLKETPFSVMGLNAASWQSYELNIHSFQPDGRVINKVGGSAVNEWLEF